MTRNSHRGHTATPEELRAQVEDTREQLSHTVEALAAKADVRGRAQAKAGQVRGQMRDRLGQARSKAHGATHREHHGHRAAGAEHGRHGTDAQSRREKTMVMAQSARDKRVLAATVGTAAVTAAVLMGRRRHCPHHR